ncbi:MAG: hypothetical protein IBX72_09790 [Nitrospirae bacterium]|nr:hypothetical protein [Nitrospirota bacterium]
MTKEDLITINLEVIYGKEKGLNAKLDLIDEYLQKVKELSCEGKEVILTGAAPVWLYLKIAHALHGRTKKLIYNSPVTGDVVIFDHNPF